MTEVRKSTRRPVTAAPTRRRRSVFAGLIAVVAALGLSAPQPVEAVDTEIGFVAGGGWNLLTQPTDPAGEFTFLWGSAFSGSAMAVGPTATAEFAERENGVFGVRADLLIGYQRGAGFADHGDHGRIDVTVSSNVVRVPVLARYRHELGDWDPTVGLGLEPIAGLSSSAVVETTDLEGEVRQVETTPTTGLAAVAAMGVDVAVDEDRVVPVEVRAGWNPFVGSSTEERFEGFESPDEPGAYRVAFDWQLLATAGIRWR